MYDGEHQMRNLKDERRLWCAEDFWILRNTWYQDDNFGLLLTNRAGTNKAGNQPEKT